MPTSPAPRSVALAALAILPAALACSSSRAQTDEDATRVKEQRVVVIDRTVEDADGFDFEVEIDGEDRAGMQVFGNDRRAVIKMNAGDREVEIEKEGEVDVDDETGLVTSLGPDARFSVEEVGDGLRRRVVVTPGPDGEPVHRYTVDGEARPFDAEAQAWMREKVGSVEAYGGVAGQGVAMRARMDGMRVQQEGMRMQREAMRAIRREREAHRESMRAHQAQLRAHLAERRAHKARRLAHGDSLRSRITLRNGVMTAVDEDGEVVVIDLDSLVSTSIGAAMEALEDMDFDFDFDFDFDEEDFHFDFDHHHEEMEAEELRHQAEALEEAAAELRREAEAMRREAEAAAREAEREE